MRIWLKLGIIGFLICAPGVVCGQSWESRASSGLLDVKWSRSGSEYVFTVYNPAGSGLVAWSLEPFNIGAPVSTSGPSDWAWSVSGGWSQFELLANSDKYKVGSAAIEPGESAIFTYTVGASSEPVNPGGLGGSAPSFLIHVGAVDGQSNGRWLQRTTNLGKTWHEVPESPKFVIPEPSCLLNISLGIFSLGCLAFKRARV